MNDQEIQPRPMHEHEGPKSELCGKCNLPYSSGCHYWDGKTI